jgi:hypothetical protein
MTDQQFAATAKKDVKRKRKNRAFSEKTCSGSAFSSLKQRDTKAPKGRRQQSSELGLVHALRPHKQGGKTPKARVKIHLLQQLLLVLLLELLLLDNRHLLRYKRNNVRSDAELQAMRPLSQGQRRKKGEERREEQRAPSHPHQKTNSPVHLHPSSQPDIIPLQSTFTRMRDQTRRKE